MGFQSYLVMAVVVTAIAGAIPLVVPGPVHALRRVLAALLLVAVVGFGLIAFHGGESFAIAHVAYAIFSCALPVVGAMLLVFGALRLRNHRLSFVLVLVVAALLLGAGGIGYYATNVEPKRLEVNTFAFDSGSESSDTLKVVVLSDIQSPRVGAYERKVVERATAQNGDIVLYAGDLYSAEDSPFPRYRQEFVELVQGLRGSQGTYFVEGDHDGDGPLKGIVEGGGATLLVDESRVVDVRGHKVGILGIDTDYNSPETQSAMQAFSIRKDLDYRIVLSHKPDAILNAPDGIDLLVSGHTHGGQVQVPFIGPLITLSTVPREQAAGGLFDYPGKRLFVTRGIGVEHGSAPVVRFGAVPEIDVLNVGL